jgi:hypothetical protein
VDLMAKHYDPLYDRSMRSSFSGLDASRRVSVAGHGSAAMAAAARSLLA